LTVGRKQFFGQKFLLYFEANIARQQGATVVCIFTLGFCKSHLVHYIVEDP
jgi:hypothetical protein